MKEIGISKLRVNCYAILEKVRKTRKPIRITRFGKPVAEIVPPAKDKKGKQDKNWLGFMKGRAEILGDITAPATDPDEWEVLRD